MATSNRRKAALALAGRQAPLKQRIVGRDVPGDIDQAAIALTQAFLRPGTVGKLAPSAMDAVRTAIRATGIPQQVSDAKWSVTHPIDRLTGKGRAANQSMVMVGGTPLRAALGLSNTARGAAAARAMNDLADMPTLPLTRDIRDLLPQMLPKAKPGQLRRGEANMIDAESRFGEFVGDRTAILQDPETGTMFVAPGVLHADLVHAVEKQFPEFRSRGTRGWMQHEVYDEHPGYGPAGAREPIPARIMHGDVGGNVRFGEVAKDTPAATIARARLLQKLQQQGLVGDVKAAQAARERMLRQRRRG